MNHPFYPTGWAQVARSIKDACDWRCVRCGLQCRRPGEMYLGWAYELTVAHLTQDYTAEVVTVAALCASCHLAHDAPLAWVARRRWARFRLRVAGQLELFT